MWLACMHEHVFNECTCTDRSAEPSPLHAYIEYGSLCILLCMFKIDQEYHELQCHTLHLNRVLVLLILITTVDLEIFV